MRYSYLLLLVVSLCWNSIVKAQEVPKGLELFELANVMDAYKQTQDISFDINFTYADSSNLDSLMEQVNASYKIHKGKFWGSIDSVEFLQGSQYNLAIYHADSLIVVNKRQENMPLMQAPIMDSAFMEANVDSVTVTRISDTIRSLIIQFKPGSFYHRYEIQYDVNTYYVKKITYYITDLDDAGPSGVTCVKATFTNYCNCTVTDQFFDESKFLIVQGGTLQPSAAYAGFDVQIIGNQDQ